MKIKNWSKFQHFKDRKPPWVKLYRDILDDIEWHELDATASKVLVMCWLIASEDDGNLPNTKTLAFRLRMSEKQTLECLNKLSHWLEQDDIGVISDGYQDDLLETETETETETEREREREGKKTQRGTRLPTDFVLSDEWVSFCRQHRPELDPRETFEGFRDYWIAQPGQKGVKTDWTATWRNWVRRQQAAKKTASEARLAQMAALTRGLATPKPAPAPFWAKPEQTVEVSDVERKRLL
jgi:hypothetical protein